MSFFILKILVLINIQYEKLLISQSSSLFIQPFNSHLDRQSRDRIRPFDYHDNPTIHFHNPQIQLESLHRLRWCSIFLAQRSV